MVNGSDGQQNAIAQILYSQKESLLSVARRRVRMVPGISPEDMVQRCISLLSNSVNSTRLVGRSPEEIRRYAVTTITHLCLRAWRKRGEILIADYADVKAQLAIDDRGFEALELQDLMEYVESHLDPDQRELLEMLYWKGMSLREISKLRDKSRAKLAHELKAILHALRACLTPPGG